MYKSYVVCKVAQLPDSLKGGFQVTPSGNQRFNLWHWLKVQKVGYQHNIWRINTLIMKTS